MKFDFKIFREKKKRFSRTQEICFDHVAKQLAKDSKEFERVFNDQSRLNPSTEALFSSIHGARITEGSPLLPCSTVTVITQNGVKSLDL